MWFCLLTGHSYLIGLLMVSQTLQAGLHFTLLSTHQSRNSISFLHTALCENKFPPQGCATESSQWRGRYAELGHVQTKGWWANYPNQIRRTTAGLIWSFNGQWTCRMYPKHTGQLLRLLAPRALWGNWQKWHFWDSAMHWNNRVAYASGTRINTQMCYREAVSLWY